MEMKNNRLEALEMKINQLDVKGTLMDLTDFHCFCVAYSRTMASSDLFIYLSVHESQSRGLVSQRAL